MSKKITIIVGIHSSWSCIEWILPACKYLLDHNKNLNIYFFILRKRKSELLPDNHPLKHMVQDITSTLPIDFLDIFPKWIKIIADMLDYLHKKTTFRLFRKIENLLVRVTLKIVGTILIEKVVCKLNPDITLMDDSNNVLFKELKRRGVKLGYIPPAPSFSFLPGVWVEEKDIFNSNCLHSPFDFFLMDNRWAADFFESIIDKKPVFEVGCPKFDSDWIDYIKKKQAHEIKDVASSNRFKILILLKNESSVIFKHSNFNKMICEIIDACSNIQNIQLIMKPHPSQNVFTLNQIVKKYTNNINLSISNENSILLINGADLIITMPSGVIFDAILLSGKPVIEYFNFSELNKNLLTRFGKIPKNVFGGMGYLTDKGLLTSVFRALDLVPGADRSFELEEMIKKKGNYQFNDHSVTLRKIFPDYASKKVAEAVLSMVC